MRSTARCFRGARCSCCNRCRADELVELLRHALKDKRGFGDQKVEIDDECLSMIANFANGDARSALSTLEMAVLNGELDGETTRVTRETVGQCTSKKVVAL